MDGSCWGCRIRTQRWLRKGWWTVCRCVLLLLMLGWTCHPCHMPWTCHTACTGHRHTFTVSCRKGSQFMKQQREKEKADLCRSVQSSLLVLPFHIRKVTTAPISRAPRTRPAWLAGQGCWAEKAPISGWEAQVAPGGTHDTYLYSPTEDLVSTDSWVWLRPSACHFLLWCRCCLCGFETKKLGLVDISCHRKVFSPPRLSRFINITVLKISMQGPPHWSWRYDYPWEFCAP